MEALLRNYDTTQMTWQIALLSCLTAFVLSSVIAKIYEKTYQGLSWSRSLMQALVLGSIVACIIMLAIGDNLARGIGIVGSLAIIRFRTNLRDPRDMVFVFAALGTGVAAGVQSYVVACVGSLTFCAAAIALRVTPFGTSRQHDGMVRFQLPSGQDVTGQTADILRRWTRTFSLVTMREVNQGKMTDVSYQVKLKRPEDAEALLDELQKIQGVRGLTFMNQESSVEM